MEKKSPLLGSMNNKQECFYLINIFYLPIRFKVEDELIAWVDDNTEYCEDFGVFDDIFKGIEKNLEGILC